MQEKCSSEKEHDERVKRAKEVLPSDEDTESACNVFRVLADPSRFKIVCALAEGELCVFHIVEVCGGTQSAVSHSLRVMKDNRIIKCRRVGQTVMYSLSDEHILEIIRMSEEHTRCREAK